jgi:phosphatidylserine/phosphatidylglycerophosphate/cardiolipin synthase-like enzyme
VSDQKLALLEKQVISRLADRAGLAADLLDAWSHLPNYSVQTERSLVSVAQLGVTEEQGAREVLEGCVEVGLLEETPHGFTPRGIAHSRFKRLAFALNAVEHYVSSVHRDETVATVVLTKPARPSVLESKLQELGWHTSELEPTDHAFHGIVRTAASRVVVMTPFFDSQGAHWLRELFSAVQPNVKRVIILRSLEDPTRRDHPDGYYAIAPWLKAESIDVFNYSIPRMDSHRRETFHAKVVLCDRSAAYIGSSNMNAASLEHSMEMGVTVRGRAATDVAVVLEAVMSAATRWT